jgi:hypothetical protein
MANAAQNAPKLQIGNLTAEDAERLAASFRPIWELDDAPFAQGNALSASEIDALAGGAGVAPSVRNTVQQQPATFEPKTEVSAPPVGRVPPVHEPKVEIAIDMEVEPDPTPPPPHQPVQAVAAPAKSPASQRPYTPPRPPPRAVKMNVEDEYAAPVKKSNTGLMIGIGLVALAIVGVIGVKAVSGSGDKPVAKPADTSTSTPRDEATHIPPPPPDTVAAQNTQPTQPVQKPSVVDTTPPVTQPTAPMQQTHTAANVTQPLHPSSGGGGSHGSTAPTHTAAAGGGTHTGGHSGIVRDNPF